MSQARTPGGAEGALLLVAPHPDDDVIGAGGLLALEAARGRRVVVVYVTDGRGAPRPEGSPGGGELARRRRQEAREGLRLLAASPPTPHFLDLESGQLASPQGWGLARAGLLRLVVGIRPADIMVTAPQEPHLTHRRVTALTVEALREARLQPRPALWGYPVWGSLWGREGVAVVDISGVVDRKARAIAAHRSQLEVADYAEGALAGNRRDAVFLETHAITSATHVERFLDLTLLLEELTLTPAQLLERRARRLIATLSTS